MPFFIEAGTVFFHLAGPAAAVCLSNVAQEAPSLVISQPGWIRFDLEVPYAGASCWSLSPSVER